MTLTHLCCSWYSASKLAAGCAIELQISLPAGYQKKAFQQEAAMPVRCS